MLDGNVLLRQKRDEVPEGTLSCPDRNLGVFHHYRHYEGLRLLPSVYDSKLIQQTLIIINNVVVLWKVDGRHQVFCKMIVDDLTTLLTDGIFDHMTSVDRNMHVFDAKSTYKVPQSTSADIKIDTFLMIKRCMSALQFEVSTYCFHESITFIDWFMPIITSSISSLELK